MPQTSLPVGVPRGFRARAAPRPGGRGLVEIRGESQALTKALRVALETALSDKHRYYAIRVETIGRVGEVLVTVSGSGGHLPLILGREDLEPGYVCRVVRDQVDRFGI